MANYVISDIHGQYERYKKLLETIKFNDNDTLYVIGDCIDRGPDGVKILQDMMTHKNIIPFIGNHEFMMLRFLDKTVDNIYNLSDIWFHKNNGGKKTFDDLMLLSPAERKQILDYVKSFYVQKVIKVNNTEFLLAHAFFLKDQKDVLYKDATYDMVDLVVWYSPFRDDELYVPFELYKKPYIYITGHVPTLKLGYEAPIVCDNILDIDGGCAYTAINKEIGSLCCVNLDKLFIDNENAIITIK